MKSKTALRIWASFVIMLGMCFMLWACGESKNGDYKKAVADTSQTFVHFITPDDRDWLNAGVQPDNPIDAKLFKIRKDTLILDSIDANTSKRIWKRDSIYIAIIQRPIIDTLTKKQKIDSASRPLFKDPIYLLLDKKFVVSDCNCNPNFRK